jgi:hypothetical protein
MLIFWKERLVLLATPKTGSTSIETALESLAHVAVRRPPALKHVSARRFDRHLRPWLEQAAGGPITTLALMREPIDWLGSWWRYRMRDDIADLPKSTAGMSFEDAARAYLSDQPGASMAVGSQARFLGIADKVAAVDQVFRYEDIDRFVHYLEDRLGGEIILPHLNVSPKGDMRLSPATEQALRARFALDYGYYATLR